MNRIATLVAGVIFLIVALVHLVRLFFPFEVSIAGWEVPIWISFIAFIVAGTLSAFMFRLSQK